MIKSEFEYLSGVTVSEETFSKLERFAELVLKWNPRINLVAKSQLETLWERHIVDSAQLHAHAPADAGVWADFGSGGGFPGIVMAVLATEFAPERRFVLVESDTRKSAFLMEASRQLGLKVTVQAKRIEDIAPIGASIVSARALAALEPLFGLLSRHMASDAVALLPKGANYQSEIDVALAKWDFLLEVAPSRTDEAARILIVSRLRAKA